jgi:hypothetical protein
MDFAAMYAEEREYMLSHRRPLFLSNLLSIHTLKDANRTLSFMPTRAIFFL